MASRSPTRASTRATSTARFLPGTWTSSRGSAGSSGACARRRIGAIGARPAAFQTVRYSEKLLQQSGITVVPVDLSDIFSRAHALGDKAAAVKRKLSEIRAYGTIPSDIPQEHVLRQAKLSVAIDDWMAENECDASAVQCWTSVQQNYGCAACLSMSLMGEQRHAQRLRGRRGGSRVHVCPAARLWPGPGLPGLEQQLRPRVGQVRLHPLQQLPKELHGPGRSRSPRWTSWVKRWAGSIASARSRGTSRRAI